MAGVKASVALVISAKQHEADISRKLKMCVYLIGKNKCFGLLICCNASKDYCCIPFRVTKLLPDAGTCRDLRTVLMGKQGGSGSAGRCRKGIEEGDESRLQPHPSYSL